MIRRYVPDLPGGPWPAMTARAANVLQGARIRSLQELATWSDRRLLSLAHCGHVTLVELRWLTRSKHSLRKTST